MNKKLGVVGIVAVLLLVGAVPAGWAGEKKKAAANADEPRPGVQTEKAKDKKARRPIPPKANDSWAARDLKKDGYDQKIMNGKDIREMMGVKD